MDKWLIVNADEFGLTESVNIGIVEAHREGIVTSTTMIVNMWAFENAVIHARENQSLGVGVHLNLTDGRPILPTADVPTLVNKEGCFYKRNQLIWKLLLGQVDFCEIRAEFEAQIKKLEYAGITPTHLDSHQSIYMHPSIFKIAISIAKERNMPMRLQQEEGLNNAFSSGKESLRYLLSPNYPKNVFMVSLAKQYRRIMKKWGFSTSDHFITTFSFFRKDNANPDVILAKEIASLRRGVTEMMSHPGYVDRHLEEFVMGGRKEAYLREEELRMLKSPLVKEMLDRNGIELLHYGQLKRGQI